jgi:hypothetical protein
MLNFKLIFIKPIKQAESNKMLLYLLYIILFNSITIFLIYIILEYFITYKF